MSTTRVQGWMWLLLAGLVCACESAPAWERTRAHRSEEREQPATDDAEEDVEIDDETTAPPGEEPARPSDAPTQSTSAPPGLPPRTADGTPPAIPVADAPASVTPVTPAGSPGLRLRGSLRIEIELPLGIALRVRLSALLESGVLRELASGDLDPSGAFDLLLAAEVEPGLLLAELLDARGNRLGAVWSARADGTRDLLSLPTINLQTLLESEVLLGSLGCAQESERRATPMTLLLDVATRIDPTLSAALTQAVERGASRELAVAALARATAAGARARGEVLSQAGVTLGLPLTQLQREVLERVSTERSQAEPRLRAAGVLDPALRTRAHVASSLAFGASLRGAFAPSSGLQEALFPALRSAAQLEAAAGSDNVLELLSAAGMNAQTRAAAEAAATTFRADVANAHDLAALSQARGKFSEAVFGRPSASAGGLLGGVLGGTLGLVGGLLNGVLSMLQQLTTKLDAALALDLVGFAEAGSCGDVAAASRRDSASHDLSHTLSGFSDEVRAASAEGAVAEALSKALASTQLLMRQSN